MKPERLRYGWHSAAVIYDIVEGANGPEPWFLLQWSRSLQAVWSGVPPQLKCIGGGRRECEDDPLVTLKREIWEESFLTLPPDLTPDMIRSFASLEGNHAKFFYLVSYKKLLGKMRRHDQGLIDGDSYLYDLGLYHWRDAIRLAVPDHSQVIREVTEMILGREVKRFELVGV